MSRKNIDRVIAAFRTHVPHREAPCRTDGETVWSYEMVIAKRSNSGTVFVADRELGPSRTTRAHIDALLLAFPRSSLGHDGSVAVSTAFAFTLVPQWRFKETS